MGHMLVIVLFLVFVYLCGEDDNKCATLPCFHFFKNKEDNDELHFHYHCPILFYFCHLVEKMMMNMQFIIIYKKKLNLHLAKTKGQQ